MEKISFKKYLEGKVEGKGTVKNYTTAIKDFNKFINGESFIHGKSKLNEVKPRLKKEVAWKYNEKDRIISRYKGYLNDKFPYLFNVKDVMELPIDSLEKLKKAMEKNGDPLLFGVSKSYASGALSAGIGSYISWKKLNKKEVQEGAEEMEKLKEAEYKRNRIIYGAPGTGKSYLLNEEANKFFENSIIEREIEEIEEVLDDMKYWVVGAKWGDEDQIERFIENSIWENGYSDKYLDKVKEVKEGDYIGIKSSFTRKKSDGNFISVLRVKALGIVKKNYEDGQKLDVEWLNTEEKDYDGISYRLTVHEAQGRHHFIFNSIKKKSKNMFLEKQEINSLERVTFYDGYTYGQFVGTYKPVPQGDGITYKYIPGPFFRQLIKAYRYPEQNFGLIIEEINRARADRVFGNIFQLLDRNEEGHSRYKIALSEDQKEYIRREFSDEKEALIYEILISEGMHIPKNLYIWATMNSADQGVYHLDTAFKRRWDFEYVELDENMGEFEDGEKECIIFYHQKNGNWDSVTWNDFREVINDNLMDIGIHEDRLIAPFFIGKSDFIRYEKNSYGGNDDMHELAEDVFFNKVLMYLFDDLLRYKKTNNPIFKDKYKCFSKLKNGYLNDNSIFNDDILAKLKKKSLDKGYNVTSDSLEE